MMSRCRDCPASALWVESGPTIRLSRAAERATIERHGHVNEYMFVNRRWRRRLQAAVGPGQGRRRAFRSPDYDHGRDSEVADTGRNRTVIGQGVWPGGVFGVLHAPVRHMMHDDGPRGDRFLRCFDGMPSDAPSKRPLPTCRSPLNRTP